MSTFWAFVGTIIILGVIFEGVVQIIKVSKKKPSGESKRDFDALQSRVESMEKELDESRSRIEVLEKIVIDDKFNLAREIDGLDDDQVRRA